VGCAEAQLQYARHPRAAPAGAEESLGVVELQGFESQL